MNRKEKVCFGVVLAKVRKLQERTIVPSETALQGAVQFSGRMLA